MKKLASVAAVMLLGTMAYVLTRSPQAQKPEAMVTNPDMNAVPAEVVSGRSAGKVADDHQQMAEQAKGPYRDSIALFRNILSQDLSLESVERWAAERNLAIEKVSKGHPKTGERLELTVAAAFPLQLVYDINTEGQTVFQAARMVFPKESDLNALKQEVKTQVSDAIASENAESVIFVDNPQGQTLWLGRTDEGKIQLALEFNIHPQDHGGP